MPSWIATFIGLLFSIIIRSDSPKLDQMPTIAIHPLPLFTPTSTPLNSGIVGNLSATPTHTQVGIISPTATRVHPETPTPIPSHFIEIIPTYFCAYEKNDCITPRPPTTTPAHKPTNSPHPTKTPEPSHFPRPTFFVTPIPLPTGKFFPLPPPCPDPRLGYPTASEIICLDAQ